MKLPIQLAFTYPDRIQNNCLDTLDLLKVGNLTFEAPDREVFKGLDLAYKAGRIGKSMPTVFNAANEIAVELFLDKKIKFLDIYKIIEKAMDNHEVEEIDNLDSILRIDQATRKWVYDNYSNLD